MTDDKVTVWEPQVKFEGSDLLPVQQIYDLDAAPKQQLVGRENVTQDDMVLPALSLLQGMSAAVQDGLEGAQPGKFWHETLQQALPAPLRVLVVHHFVSRAAFPGAKPHLVPKRCISKDGVTGTEYGDCDACQYKEWVACDDGKSRAPCGRQHNFVVLTENGPAVLRFRSKSYPFAKRFLSAWMGSPHNLWDFPCIVTTKLVDDEIDGQKVKSYVMAIRWELRDPTSDIIREHSRKTFDTVNAAHEAGNLDVNAGSDTEESL